MKILVLGAGPGGLYSAALLKKANPHNQITVLERNAPDATFGWGIVFSDQTLDSLREADPPTHQAITDNFAHWDAIDVYYKGEMVRSHGHVFAGMSRKVLLGLLQQRCAELGVEMRFHHEFGEIDELIVGYDLVIAADGVNSVVRRRFADHFQPTLDMRTARYVWLGTDWHPDAFTYIVHENQHGVFQGTIYPYSPELSTFIAECDEPTWRRSGLDQASEAETIAYCEALFAAYLGGHRLLSNKSIWLNFLTVKNTTWHYRNIVLVGDAAHTAHFTVGSGTKMAMEDAIGLAEAFQRHEKIEDALTYYEELRSPVIERIQEAARQSYTWCENLNRYVGFDPIQLALNYLTRSGRVSYENLKVRDELFVEAVDRWYARQSAGSDAPVFIAPPPLFTALKLRDLTLLNRAVLSPVGLYSAVDGAPSEAHCEQLLSRARGGAGLVMTELTAISPEGRITPGDTGLYREEHVATWSRIVDQIHAASTARVAIRLGHAGRRGSTRPRWEGLDRPLRAGNWPLLAASALPYDRGSQVPKAMDRADMDRVRDDFVRAALLADTADFDLLELHMAHGYLLASFLSPLTNRRTDEYGGALANRLRFPLEVFDAVRAAWPAAKPLAVCLSATDWARRGFTPEEAVVVARTLKEHGCDLVEVLAGQTVLHDQPTYGRSYLTPYSDQVRNEAGVRTLIRGNITTTDEANTLLAAGRADLCVIDPPAAAGFDRRGR